MNPEDRAIAEAALELSWQRLCSAMPELLELEDSVRTLTKESFKRGWMFGAKWGLDEASKIMLGVPR